MLRKTTRLAVLSSLLLLTGALAAWAAPITFESSSYTAYVAAYFNSEKNEPVNKTHLSPPSTQIFTTISHSASVTEDSETKATATAGVSNDTSLTFLSATAEAKVAEAYAYSSMEAEFTFTATFPQIRISYDYKVKLQLTGSEDDNVTGGIKVYLQDTSAGGGDVVVQDLITSGEGSLVWTYSLTTGHKYLLYIGATNLAAELEEGAYGFASVSLDNIDIQAVPLPSALFLVGTGLLGLWGLRRRRPQ